jgi:hypothetical protein
MINYMVVDIGLRYKVNMNAYDHCSINTTVKLYNSDGRLMSDGPVGNRRTYGYVRRPTAAVENKKI